MTIGDLRTRKPNYSHEQIRDRLENCKQLKAKDMTQKDKNEITRISKEFAQPILEGFGLSSINGSGWVVVDPLSAYLNACGWKNELKQIPASDKNPLILIMAFKAGGIFIPAGGDMAPNDEGLAFHNWQWI